MDSVRFGRALGIGVREAAKAAVKAADAAAAPSPGGAPARLQPERRVQVERPVETRGRVAAKQTVQTARGIKQGGKRLGEAVWGPFAKLSGVLWHEIMGVLFGMFAAVAGVEAWHGRGSLRMGAEGRTHELFALGMLVGFGYFTASSFVRASRRQRR
jgi:hypothetical protein